MSAARWWQRPGFSLVAVLTVLLAAVAFAAQTEPATSRAPASGHQHTRFVPVARAGAVCPDAVTDATTRTTVAVAAPGAVDNRTPAQASATGTATVGGLGPRAAVRQRLTERGSTSYAVPIDARPDDASRPDDAADGLPLQAAASGALAPGFAVSMTTSSTSDQVRGLAGTSCVAPDTDFWFVGSGAVVGQRGRLYLTNPESVPAVVDVTLYGPSGPISAPGGRGVTVAAGGQRVLKLDALAPDVVRFGVHVQVRQGRVSAALRDQQLAGLTPRGADWVPVAAPPSRRLLVPGVLGGAGERRLQLVVPGDSDAIVRVRLVAPDGAFVPSGLDVVEARSGRVTDLDLAPFAGQQPVAVELMSDQPVTAGLVNRLGGAQGKPSELAYTASAPTLSAAAPGVLADLRGSGAGSGLTSTLFLAAPDGPATVLVSVLAPATGEPMRVVVPAGSQLSVAGADLSTAASFAATVVPVAGSGPVMAATEILGSDPSGPVVTMSVVAPPRYAVRVPSVLADLSTGLRPRTEPSP